MQAEGHWNSVVYVKTAGSSSKEVFWKVEKSKLLQKYVVHENDLVEYESARLWCGLTEALLRGEEEEAIQQKTVVEQRQRELRATREQLGTLNTLSHLLHFQIYRHRAEIVFSLKLP